MRLSLLSRRTTATQALYSSAGKSSVMSTDHKQQAKRLRTSLAERGVEVTHSEALELVAHQYGARDWNTLAAATRRPPAHAPAEFGPVIPVLRIFDVDKAREFYTDFLGFSIDWEHTFDDHAPVYLQASRDGARAAPERAPRRRQPRRDGPRPRRRRDAAARRAARARLPLRQAGHRDRCRGGCEVAVLDPFANRIVFHQLVEDAEREHRGRRQAAGPIEHEYVVACSPEHAFARLHRGASASGGTRPTRRPG